MALKVSAYGKAPENSIELPTGRFLGNLGKSCDAEKYPSCISTEGQRSFLAF